MTYNMFFANINIYILDKPSHFKSLYTRKIKSYLQDSSCKAQWLPHSNVHCSYQKEACQKI